MLFLSLLDLTYSSPKAYVHHPRLRGDETEEESEPSVLEENVVRALSRNRCC